MKMNRVTRRIVATSALVMLTIPFGMKFYVESQSTASQRQAGKFLLLGDVPQARAQVKWLHFLSPSNPIALHVLGMCEEIEGNRTNAIGFYQQAVTESSLGSDLHQQASIRLGISLSEERLFDRAEDVLTTHIEQYPESNQPRAILKTIYVSQLRLTEAYRVLISAIGDTSDNQFILLELLSVENYPNANDVVTYMIDILKDHPRQASVHLALGVAYWRTGDFQNARPQFREALTLRPNDRRFRIVAAEFYLEDGRQQESMALVDNTPPDDNDDHYWSLRSRIAERENRFEDAVSYMDNALRIDPAERRYIYSKARLLQRLGKSAQAEMLHTQVNRIAAASLELLGLSLQMAKVSPNADDIVRLGDQYELAERPQVADAWRSLTSTTFEGDARQLNQVSADSPPNSR